MHVVDGHEDGNLRPLVLEILVLERIAHIDDGAVGRGKHPVVHLVDDTRGHTEETHDQHANNQHQGEKDHIHPPQVGQEKHIAKRGHEDGEEANDDNQLTRLMEFHHSRSLLLI